MGTFDSFEYDIKSRMPEWWKEDALAKPINKYTQDLIANIIESLLSSVGVVQPINVWKTIPEEYNWFHHYTPLDSYLIHEDEDSVTESVSTFFANSKTIAYLPNTKRKCNANIHLKLLGSEEFSIKSKLSYLKIYNGTQEIHIYDVPKTATIDIITETQQIFIDGKERPDLVIGYFDKIEPSVKNENYDEVDIQDENKETKIVFEVDTPVKFDLQIYLFKPTYVTEQNIRVASVSAFPIESIELWGYFCHPFNKKQGYEFLWKKNYRLEDRVVYDRITKKYDCERFYVKVKFYGIGSELIKGFPQEEFPTNPAFQINKQLDKWGKVYGLHRRYYRTDIQEEEEPYTYPKYYNYPIEQDYWYEERMVNEYRFVDGYVNSRHIRDSDLKNVALLEAIHPSTDDIWVYTETIDASDDNTREVKGIPVHDIEEVEDSLGVEIKDIDKLTIKRPASLTRINPLTDEILKKKDSSYQTKLYKCSFDLRPYKETIPKDIKVKGIELKFKSGLNLKSNSLTLSDDSCLLLPIYSPIYKEYKTGKVTINKEMKFWKRDQLYLTIGQKDYLFGEEEITREQLFAGENEHIEFELRFINESDFLEAELLLEDISLNLYYETIPDKYDIEVDISDKTISLRDLFPETTLNITVTNKSEKEIGEKKLFIILPMELEFKEGNSSYQFSFDKDEPPFTIQNIIRPKQINNQFQTGYYDILIFCEDHVIKKEILVRS